MSQHEINIYRKAVLLLISDHKPYNLPGSGSRHDIIHKIIQGICSKIFLHIIFISYNLFTSSFATGKGKRPQLICKYHMKTCRRKHDAYMICSFTNIRRKILFKTLSVNREHHYRSCI